MGFTTLKENGTIPGDLQQVLAMMRQSQPAIDPKISAILAPLTTFGGASGSQQPVSQGFGQVQQGSQPIGGQPRSPFQGVIGQPFTGQLPTIEEALKLKEQGQFSPMIFPGFWEARQKHSRGEALNENEKLLVDFARIHTGQFNQPQGRMVI